VRERRGNMQIRMISDRGRKQKRDERERKRERERRGTMLRQSGKWLQKVHNALEFHSWEEA